LFRAEGMMRRGRRRRRRRRRVSEEEREEEKTQRSYKGFRKEAMVMLAVPWCVRKAVSVWVRKGGVRKGGGFGRVFTYRSIERF